MMMNTSWKFEGLQSLKLFSWYTDSGFSGEDLVSDLLGFYRAVLPGVYSYRLRPVSYESALRRWDHYGAIGSHKNDGFRPIHFPDPADRCVKHYPYKGHLPKFLTWIQPWSDFTAGVVKPVANDGTTLEFRGEK